MKMTIGGMRPEWWSDVQTDTVRPFMHIRKAKGGFLCTEKNGIYVAVWATEGGVDSFDYKVGYNRRSTYCPRHEMRTDT